MTRFSPGKPCLGITLHPGAELRCRRLSANVIDFDNGSGATKLYADGIQARVVRLLQVVASLGIGQPLAGLVAEGKVEADYIQHNAGDLNPSWDYEKGSRSVLRRDFVERSDNPGSDAPAILDIDGIRKELTLGKNPFAKVSPLVEKAAAPAMLERREVDDPVLGELRAWIATHPGPQRQLAADLRERWVTRLLDAPAEVKTEASRAVKTALASPKLTSERHAILKAIAGAL